VGKRCRHMGEVMKDALAMLALFVCIACLAII
jgi:hypothetical protein